MGQAANRSSVDTLDLVITNALIVDWSGIYKVICYCSHRQYHDVANLQTTRLTLESKTALLWALANPEILM